MEQGARIDVSAIKEGDGGTVVLWSDIKNLASVTSADGEILARGAGQRGAGGRVETYGHSLISGLISVDAGADDGDSGLWLIDPFDYVIDVTASGNIVSTLNTGTSVTITTAADNTAQGSTGSGAGDITVSSAITATGNADLTLSADGDISIDAPISVAGALNFSGQDIALNNNLVTTAVGAGVSLLSRGHIEGTSAASVTTAGGDVLFASDTDSVSSAGGHIRFTSGLNVDSNGGDITLAGGDSAGTGYALGNVQEKADGITIDGGLSLTSLGGDIALRGKSSAGAIADSWWAWGIGWTDSAVTLDSSTGTISIDGVSETSNNLSSGLYFSNTDTTTFSSANTTANAISIKGDASTSTSGNSFGADFGSATTKIHATGAGGGITLDGHSGNINVDLVLRNTKEILAVDGPISLVGRNTNNGSLTLDGTTYLGSRSGVIASDGTDMSNSSSDISFQHDEALWGVANPDINTTGAFSWTSTSDSFYNGAGRVKTSWFNFSGPIGGLRIGKASNTTNVEFDSDVVVAGPIAVYAGEFSLVSGNTLTSSDSGDVFIKSNSATNASLILAGDIVKTGGDRSTLTLQADGRVSVQGTVAASGTALDTVLWSDFSDSGSGGVSINNLITTNGGHLWAGGSLSDGGSSIWNTLTVGDGASHGADGFNHNALDLYSSVSTNGGDVLLWAGDGYNTGVDGIGVSGTQSIDSGTGDITLIGNEVAGGTIQINSTGTLAYAPHDNAWTTVGGELGYDGNISADTFTGLNDVSWLSISNYSSLGGLSLGKAGTSSSLRIFDPIDIDGTIHLYGDGVSVDGALDTTGATRGDVLIQASADVEINSTIDVSGDVSIVSGNDLTMYDAVTKTGSQDTDTLLQSARHIVLHGAASISTSAGTQNLKLWADQDNSGDGINIVGNSIDSNGGSVEFGNGDTAIIQGVATEVGGDVYFNGAAAQTLETNGGDLTVRGETILANASGVSISSNGGDVDFQGLINSGNQYDYIDGPDGQSNSWDYARTQAINGTGGSSSFGDSYLVTINSRLENAIAGFASGYKGAWIGAYRPSGNNWLWADGPEAGDTFLIANSGVGGGATQSGYFSNFASSEPNGHVSSGENRGQFFGVEGHWNDLASSTSFSATQDTDYSVLGFVRETNLVPTALTINAGSGLVSTGGIGGSKALSSLSVMSAGATVNGDALITTGAQTFSSSVDVISAADLNIASSTLTTQGDLLAKANGNIDVSSAIETNSGDVTYWSDSDADGSGYVSLASGTSIATSGGDIVVAGGADAGSDGVPDGPASGEALLNVSGNFYTGVSLYESELDTRVAGAFDASAGDVTLNGKSTYTDSTTDRAVGVFLYGSKVYGNNVSVTGSAIDSNGTSTRYGISSNGDASPNNTNISAFADITLAGTVATPEDQYALRWGTNHELNTVGGNITINAEGQLQYLSNQTLTLADTKSLIFNSNYNAEWRNVIAGDGGLRKQGTGDLVLSEQNTYTGATNIDEGLLIIRHDAPLITTSIFNGPGALAIEPASVSFSGPFSWQTASNNLSGLRIGISNNNAAVSIDTATTVAGDIYISGSDVDIDVGLTSSGNNDVLIDASGTATSGENGFVVADGLTFVGSGDLTLENSANDVSTLSASTGGAVRYVDSNALTVGTKSSVDGVTAGGTVAIATFNGDLTLDQVVSSSDNTATALTLSAGSSQAAGNATGGNIIVGAAGAVTVSAGGNANLYSGDVADSTGLGALVGQGSGRFRYNSDESISNFTTALGAGVNAIYREAPQVTVSADDTTMTYGDALPTLNVSISPLANGDSSAQALTLSGSPTIAGDQSNSGHWTAGTHALNTTTSSKLGYDVVDTAGELTVNRRLLNPTTSSAQKTYDGNEQITAVVMDVADQLVGDQLQVVADGSFDDRHAGADKNYLINQYDLQGEDATNYRVDASSDFAGSDGVVSAQQLTITAVADKKFYDGDNSSQKLPTVEGLQGTDTVTALTQSFDLAQPGERELNVDSVQIVDGNAGQNYQVIAVAAAGQIKTLPEKFPPQETNPEDGGLAQQAAFKQPWTVDGPSLELNEGQDSWSTEELGGAAEVEIRKGALLAVSDCADNAVAGQIRDEDKKAQGDEVSGGCTPSAD